MTTEYDAYKAQRISDLETWIKRQNEEIETLGEECARYKRLIKPQERRRDELDEQLMPVKFRMGRLQSFIIREATQRLNRIMSGEVIAAMQEDTRVTKWEEELNTLLEAHRETLEERERVHQEVVELRHFGAQIGTHRERLAHLKKRLERMQDELKLLRDS